ncbi:MAG: isochorismatase family protein [Rhodobacteraceae bacterium]|nr:isochorismatase family protein [Paracoccaceae bacterium]
MAKSALILIDIQNDYFPGGNWELHKIEESAANARRLLEQARADGQTIVHVRHESPEGAPFFAVGSKGAEIHPTMQPSAEEAVVTKTEVNAFKGTDLKQILDDASITAVTIAGDMSHMCVDAATRAASDFGYDVTLVEDACSSRDLEFNGDVIPAEQAHKAFMSALGFAYATVTTTDAYLAG